MTETTTVVVGGDRGIGRGLTAALEQQGRRVVVLTDGSVDLTDPDAVRAAFVDASAPAPVTTVVLAHLDPAALRSTPLLELGEAGWEAAAERSLRAAFVVLQQAHAAVPDDARIVLVLPTTAASGAAGLVALCTAVEGIRVMAKAVARRWGARGITVTTIEVDLAAFVLGDAADDAEAAASVPAVSQLGTPALAPGSVVADVVGLIEVLESPAGAALTGGLLVADRGTVMQP
jgi:3-oxoacyl-[acyl-carrier protein] reductase/cyclic-di-GMP-binding biofilm dispersal mediator protein